MPGPCPYALVMSRVPCRRWSARTEITERLEFVRQQIDASPGAGFSLESLAAMAGFSPSHLSRLFAKTYGQSLSAYRSAKRLELAAQLLLAGEPLWAVASRCGFSSEPTFSREFRQRYGDPPGRWRKRNSG